jgi:hypothetical protein
MDAIRLVRLAVALALVAASLANCTLLVSDLPDPIEPRANDGDGGESGEDTAGSGARGGSDTARGGNESGGEDGSGGRSTSGGSATSGGGNGSSGAENGGSTTGGKPTGGNANAGSATGGNSNGGNVNGGSVNGGTSTGGDSTGGDSTGGDSTGGNSTGGNPTGGNTTGGRASGGTTSGGSGGSDSGSGGTPPDCDRDDDGVLAPGAMGCSGPDCDDTDHDAHPGQQSFFEEQRASGGFDYDCSGQGEPQFASALDCGLLALDDCSGEGFSGSLPACGASGTWIRCALTVQPLPLLCEAQNLGTRRMPCH